MDGMARFSLRQFFWFCTVAAIEAWLLVFIAGRQMDQFVFGWAAGPLVCLWIWFGGYIGLNLFVFFQSPAQRAALGAAIHFAIAFVSIYIHYA